MTEEGLKGVAKAIRIIKAMGYDWPDAIGRMKPTRSIRDDYGDQFVRRILEAFPEAEKYVPFNGPR